MPNDAAWLAPWYAVTDNATCAGLEEQLRREIAPTHVLSGQTVRLIARRADTDDALFALSDGRVAEVHLTWRGSTETDPRWPATALYASLADWMREEMAPLHRLLMDRP
jgi:hypothetical protein